MIKRILTVLLFVVLSGCDDKQTFLPDTDQKILFQVEYINYAWGYVHYGMLIDNSGNVRTYRQPVSWNFPDGKGYLSAADMEENINQLDTLDFTVAQSTLLRYFIMVRGASLGPLSDPEGKMADFGEFSYFGYLYDPARKIYKQVLMRQWGDWLVENKSPEAREIYDWLVTLSQTNIKSKRFF